MQGMYYKRRTLIFSFSHHTERKRSASYRNKVEMLHIVERQRNNVSSEKAFYEALCVLHASGVSSTQKYEAHFVLASFARQASKYMKHACRRMKRILFRLHVFLPGIWAKNGVEDFVPAPCPHCKEFKTLLCRYN